MRISIRLFATLRDYLPRGAEGYEAVMEMEDGAAVKAVIERLRIPSEMRLIIFINSVHAEETTVLRGGDVLAMFPLMAGG